MNNLQRTPEWHEDRRGLVTASSVGAILGLSPYADRDDVMRRMVREAHDAIPEFIGNVATQWGIDHEAEALSELERELGDLITPCGFIVHDNGWLGASPDGLLGDDCVIEVKCPYNQKYFELADRPDYMAQIQTQMYCTGRPKGIFAVWTPDSGIRFEHVEAVDFDAEYLDRLAQFNSEFCEIVEDAEKSAPHLEDLIQDFDDHAEWLDIAEDFQKCRDEIKAKQAELANGS